MRAFTNRRLGPAAEVFVSEDVARAILVATSVAAREAATARWEHELADWLATQAPIEVDVDVADIAWSLDHFEAQRRFVLGAIERAARRCDHGRALALWGRQIEAYRREDVGARRRWAKSISNPTY